MDNFSLIKQKTKNFKAKTLKKKKKDQRNQN